MNIDLKKVRIHRGLLMLYIIICTFICLIVVTIVRKKKPSASLQFLTHTILYLFEILVVTFLINKWFLDIGEDLSSIDTLKNYVFAYTIYQLFLLITFKLKDSLDIDAYTSLKYLIDMYQLYGEFNEKIPENLIAKVKDGANDLGIVYNAKVLKEVKTLENLARDYNSDKISTEMFRFYLKQRSINIDLGTKTVSYAWMNSVLIRWVK
ncbi:hypothetical protein OKW24_005636 [Peribacillus simplex]|uniref:hypothetical protein n=1 Tax=Peribacillus simplex TaxID=1478 RepID=UPI0024E21AD7|nr:hypothetical protein [Peribacillus simplex]MDF9763725.1 hypothetical protein [Peribacillus simplex]MDF9763740.1 hypothetical protein [Peribacillus simplex]